MSYFLKFPGESPVGNINAALQKVIADAKKEWSNLDYGEEWATNGYGITSIRPKHVQCGGAAWGSSNFWASCFAASVTWEAWINITQTDAAFEIVTGWFDLEVSPKVAEIYFSAAGKELPSINIEDVFSFDGDTGFWFRKPLAIYPNKPWAFYRKGINTGIEREGLKGFTVATQAFLIGRA